jgi:hypothetical protein
MDRRSFLKNSIFALLAGSISSNKVLSDIAETLTPSSTKVLLYLIQNKKGYWFVRGTKWVDIAKSKINEQKYNIDTFKPLDIVDNSIADNRRLELWVENNCGGGPGGGTGFPLNVEKSFNAQKIAIKSEGFKIYVESELKKINSSILGKKNAARGIPQKNGLKALELPIERRLAIYQKSAQSRTGRKASADHCFSISNSLKGKSKSAEHIKNMSLSRIGKKQSQETIAKKKVIFAGAGNPMYNRNHTDKTRQQISQNHGAKTIKVCPHCGKECGANNYPRYHGDNCKIKNK